MNPGRLFQLFLFLLMLQSCKTEEELVPPVVNVYSLTGEWKWISSCGGYGGDCYTPESTGDTFSITFTTNDRVIIVENSDTLLQADYYVKRGRGNVYNTFEEKDIIYINSDTAFITKDGYFLIAPDNFNHFIIISLDDTLHLEEDCCDGFGYLFARKPQRRPAHMHKTTTR